MSHPVYRVSDSGEMSVTIDRGLDIDTPEGLKVAEDLKMMARNWKSDYASHTVPGAQYLYKEFLEQIDEHILPSLALLMERNLISRATYSSVWDVANQAAEEIREMT